MSILRDYQQNRCYLCGEKMAAQGDITAPDVFMPSIEHVIPRAGVLLKDGTRGPCGTNRLGNVALAHKGCNNFKADRAPTACEKFFAESMAQCFVDAHRSEPWQAFSLHVRGKGLMYLRPAAGPARVVSRKSYREELKRKAMKGAA